MEKKEIVRKISKKCLSLDLLEKIGLEERVEKEIKDDLKRKRQNYDESLGKMEKKRKFDHEPGHCNLEENRKKWREFSVSYFIFNVFSNFKYF